ncbi:odorant receptor 10-like [Periplaneta americana]|uniref:odorant receptor 10-like n=1 Tax=Periplaneta americana TaxID=6978 RepID=UPI0037E73834
MFNKRFIMELEDVFNPMMLAQFLSSSGTLCLIIFQITVMEDAGFGMATFVQFLAISIMQLLLFCWYGNELTFQCESVVRAAYESSWYEASISFKSSLCMMIMRAMKPFRLTGGKLYVMSLDTFVAIMKASFSYFTMLNQLNGSK